MSKTRYARLRSVGTSRSATLGQYAITVAKSAQEGAVWRQCTDLSTVRHSAVARGPVLCGGAEGSNELAMGSQGKGSGMQEHMLRCA